MNITEFLEARIAEDEALAVKAARGSDGKWHRGHGWMPDEDECRVEGDSIVIYDEGGHDPDQADHIAAHDPARVLAECAAKRAIIAEHKPVDYSSIGMESPNACQRCGMDASMHDWEWVEDSFPCDTLKAFAAVYANHPDYQQEWARG